MRYRKYRTLKTAFLFLSACFMCGLLLHTQTDRTNYESRRNSKCGNAPWCMEEYAGKTKTSNTHPPPHQQREKDKSHEQLLVLQNALRKNDPDVIGDAIRKTDPVLDKVVIEKNIAAVDPNLGDNNAERNRRLVDMFRPANIDNVLPKKEGSERNMTVNKNGDMDADHRPVQVGKYGSGGFCAGSCKQKKER